MRSSVSHLKKKQTNQVKPIGRLETFLDFTSCFSFWGRNMICEANISNVSSQFLPSLGHKESSGPQTVRESDLSHYRLVRLLHGPFFSHGVLTRHMTQMAELQDVAGVITEHWARHKHLYCKAFGFFHRGNSHKSSWLIELPLWLCPI